LSLNYQNQTRTFQLPRSPSPVTTLYGVSLSLPSLCSIFALILWHVRLVCFENRTLDTLVAAIAVCHGRRLSLRVADPSSTVSDCVSSSHGCGQAWRCLGTSPSPPTSINRPEIGPTNHVLCS
jgi:hypothetical protein